MNASQRPLVVDSLGFLRDPFNPSMGDAEGATPEAIAAALGSGLVATNLTVSVATSFEETMATLDVYDELIEVADGKLRKVLTAADIDEVRSKEGSLGVIYGFQNSAMIENDLNNIDRFIDRGVRVFQLTYNVQNQIGSGSLAPEDTGLTEFGREALAKLHDSGVIVDLSHGSYQLTMDVIAASQQTPAPSITHSGCAALSSTPRNKIDEELRGIADLGGYVGIYIMPFLALGRNYGYEDFFAHVDHAINICGEDTVGIGIDQGICDLGDPAVVAANYAASVTDRRARGISAPGEDPEILPYPKGFVGPEKYRQLEQALRNGGYTDTRIEKIMGLNFRNYAERIWGS